MNTFCDNRKQNKTTKLCFSTSYLKVVALNNIRNYKIDQPTIIINAGINNVKIKNTCLRSWQSAIFQNVTINTADSLIFVVVNVENYLKTKYPFNDEIIKNWTHVYDIFLLPQYKKTKLWRSSKHKIGDASFNLWFAQAGTSCGIHNRHDFKEIHTQIYGIGRMQKFDNNEYESLYQDIYMSPGYTHEPFYDADTIYPYHQYYADTDCIWLVREF